MAQVSIGKARPEGAGFGGTKARAYVIHWVSGDRINETDFRSELEGLRDERPELHFLVSGPWPPYTFANIDLEFETQFGVS
jgi:hypothetical protein